MRGHDDVGGVGRGNSAEVVADLAEVVDDDVDRGAAGGSPSGRQLGDCGLAVLVSPDGDRGAGRDGRLDAAGEDCENRSRHDSEHHGSAFRSHSLTLLCSDMDAGCCAWQDAAAIPAHPVPSLRERGAIVETRTTGM